MFVFMVVDEDDRKDVVVVEGEVVVAGESMYVRDPLILSILLLDFRLRRLLLPLKKDEVAVEVSSCPGVIVMF